MIFGSAAALLFGLFVGCPHMSTAYGQPRDVLVMFTSVGEASLWGWPLDWLLDYLVGWSLD
jgi:hypothetical protein